MSRILDVGTADLLKVKNKKKVQITFGLIAVLCASGVCGGFYSELPDEWSKGPSVLSRSDGTRTAACL